MPIVRVFCHIMMLENTVLKVQIDTGAEVNILPTRCYSQIFQDAIFSRANPSKANLTAYAGSTIRHHGTISISCSLRTAPCEFEIEFYICDSNGPALLGHQDAIRLKMISENKKHGHRCKDHCHSETGTATNQRPGSPHVPIYPNNFKGQGKFPGKYRIQVREDTSYMHPGNALLRPKKKYRENSMKWKSRKSSISKIDDSQPTEWLSNLASARKSNGDIRICLDPRDLNAAIRRTYHRSPNVEEIT